MPARYYPEKQRNAEKKKKTCERYKKRYIKIDTIRYKNLSKDGNQRLI